jgi:hypothetical protein
MDEYTADAFANRDEPVPLLAVDTDSPTPSPAEADPAATTSRSQKIKGSLSASRWKAKTQDFVAGQLGERQEVSSPGAKASLQERLFSK